MAIITAAQLCIYIDHVVRFLIDSEGVEADGTGLGQGVDTVDVWGASDEVANIKAAMLADANLDSVKAVINHVDKLTQLVSSTTYAVNMFAPFLGAIENHVTRFGLAGVRSLDDYLTLLNTGESTKWQALQHPYWRDLRPYRLPSIWNCYEAIGVTAGTPDGLASLNIAGADTFTAGDSVDQTKHAGGLPAAEVLIALNDTSAGTFTVTGTAYDPATKAFLTGRTWVITVATNIEVLNPAGGNPAPVNSLIAAVSNIVYAGPAATGKIAIVGLPPSRGTVP